MSRISSRPVIPQARIVAGNLARLGMDQNFAKNCPHILEGIGSQELTMMAGELKLFNSNSQQEFLIAAESVLSKFAQGSVFSEGTESQLGEVRESLLMLSSNTELSSSLFASIQQKTSAAVSAMAKDTGKAERQIYIHLIEDSMKSLGYNTLVSVGENAAAVQATRGHEVRVIGIDEKLNLERDGAGLSGKACVEADDRIEEELEKRGLGLGKAKRSYDHGDAKGGDIIRSCGKQQQGNLAEGYVSYRGGAKPGLKTLHKSARVTNKMMEAN